MFDDLRTNFVMNPQNGLTIKPFWKAHANRDTDQELVKLTQYLLAIADLADLSALDIVIGSYLQNTSAIHLQSPRFKSIICRQSIGNCHPSN